MGVPSEQGASSVVGTSDGATYTRGSLKSSSQPGLTGYVYGVVKQSFTDLPFLYPLNVAEDPTNEYWRLYDAPAGYTFTPYVGIRSGVAIQSMKNMFKDNTTFNEDISGWDVSSVSNMSGAFEGCTSFNQDLSPWNVQNVTNMHALFYKCANFNQDLNSWNTSSCTDFSYIFDGTLMSYSLSSWTVAGDIGHMFSNTNYNQPLPWDTSNVTDMSRMFYGNNVFNQDISSWNTSNVTSMSYMFVNAHAFNQDISSWDVSNVVYMSRMFEGARAFNQDISSWDISSANSISSILSPTGGFDAPPMAFNQDLSSWGEHFTFGALTSSFSYDEEVWTLPKPPVIPFESYQITPNGLGALVLEYLTNNGRGLLSIGNRQNDPNPDENNPTITLTRGWAYTFINNSAIALGDYFDDSKAKHPLYITTDDGTNFVSGQYVGEYTNGYHLEPYEFFRSWDGQIQITDPRSVIRGDKMNFVVPIDAPDTLYIQCGTHSPMKVTLNIVDPS